MGIPAASFLESCNATVLLFDYRKLGLSSGWPRQEVIPSEQLDDFVNAIFYVRNMSFVNSSRIGIWGISMTGGHVLQLGTWWGQYLGVKAVVAVVPSIRVVFTADLLFSAGGVNGFFRPLLGQRLQQLYDNDGNVYADQSDEWGVDLSTQHFPTVSQNCETQKNCFFTVPPSYEWFMNASKFGEPAGCQEESCKWQNYTSMKSIESVLQYFPMANGPITQIAMLQLTAQNDPFFPNDQQRWAHEQMQSPVKKLVVYPDAGHYDLYPAFEDPSQPSINCTAQAIEWFNMYLNTEYDLGTPLAEWPSSAENCGDGTKFSNYSMNCVTSVTGVSNTSDGDDMISTTEIVAWVLMSIFCLTTIGLAYTLVFINKNNKNNNHSDTMNSGGDTTVKNPVQGGGSTSTSPYAL